MEIKDIKKETEEIFSEITQSLIELSGALGLKPPKEPPQEVKDMELPSDLTSLNNTELTRFMNAFTQMNSYAESLVSYLDTMQNSLDTRIRFREAEIVNQGKATVQERKAKLLVEARDLFERKLSVDMAFSYINMLAKSYEKSVNVLSRELTRRLAENANISKNVKNI